MLKITQFQSYEKEDGTEFNVLTLSGGLEAVKSSVTGQMYFTMRKVNVPCTFDSETCKSLIGTDFAGSIKKVEVEPYEYELNNGETITLTHQYEFVSDEQEILTTNLVEKSTVL